MEDNEDNVTPIRSPAGKFVKGQSGNPAGGNKPRVYRAPNGERIDMQDLYLENAPRVFAELMRLIVDPKVAATAKVSAIKEYNDRAFGKAAQQMRISKADDVVFDTIDPSQLSTEVLTAIVQARIERTNAS
jgi:hypothetical protein